jgi:hypothetical protein
MPLILRKYLLLFLRKDALFFVVPVIIFVYLACLDLQTVDYGHHISMAKHYKENWFSLTDYKRGYIDVGNYPPLAHQLLALLSFIMPMKTSYYLITLVFWILASLYASLFFFEYLEIKNKYLPACFLFSSLSLAMLKSIFQWAQYTTIVGFCFGFMGLYYFLKALRNGDNKNFLSFLLSTSLLIFSHHLSSLIFSFMFAFLIPSEFDLCLKRARKLTCFCVLLALLIVIGNYPSLQRFLSQPVPTVEIFHESRKPTGSFDIENWIISYYGVTLLLIPIIPFLPSLLKFKSKARFIKLYLILMFLLLIGLGRWTPLTKLFMGLEHWLTYERFSMLSGIMFSLFFAFFLLHSVEKRKPIFTIYLLAFALTYAFFNMNWLFSLWGPIYGRDPAEINALKLAEHSVVDSINNLSRSYRY